MKWLLLLCTLLVLLLQADAFAPLQQRENKQKKAATKASNTSNTARPPFAFTGTTANTSSSSSSSSMVASHHQEGAAATPVVKLNTNVATVAAFSLANQPPVVEDYSNNSMVEYGVGFAAVMMSLAVGFAVGFHGIEV